jgi:hypothetical protein
MASIFFMSLSVAVAEGDTNNRSVPVNRNVEIFLRVNFLRADFLERHSGGAGPDVAERGPVSRSVRHIWNRGLLCARFDCERAADSPARDPRR